MSDATTHYDGCWRAGRKHYGCALARIEALEDELEIRDTRLEDRETPDGPVETESWKDPASWEPTDG